MYAITHSLTHFSVTTSTNTALGYGAEIENVLPVREMCHIFTTLNGLIHFNEIFLDSTIDANIFILYVGSKSLNVYTSVQQFFLETKANTHAFFFFQLNKSSIVVETFF